MEIVNLNQVCTISAYRKSRHNSFTYVKENWEPNFIQKLFGKEPKDLEYYKYSGYFEVGNRIKVTDIADFLKEKYSDLYIDPINKEVYYQPHIDMRLSNENLRTKLFNTAEELDKYINNILKDYPNMVILW